MNEHSYTPVRRVMVPDPKVVDRLATVAEAIELMREHHILSLIHI